LGGGWGVGVLGSGEGSLPKTLSLFVIPSIMKQALQKLLIDSKGIYLETGLEGTTQDNLLAWLIIFQQINK
jgi:hypothetical protein